MYIFINNVCKYICNIMSLIFFYVFDESILNINYYYRKIVFWLKNKIFKGLYY